MTAADGAARLLGAKLVRAKRLHGGDLSCVQRIWLADGRTAVLKTGPRLPAEAEMLRALTAAGVPAPRVLAVAEDLLLLEDLGADEGPGAAWADLGRVLRRLHDTLGDGFGWHADHGFGPVAIQNTTAATWPAFWAERRLLPFCPHIPADLAARVERLAARLSDVLPDTPVPSLLHGDLWTGNVMAKAGRVTGLIDPACYIGDAEVDLAMLTLFGHPGPAFWEAYGSLADGFETRQPIYQLWPALVHLRLFGDGYRDLVERCLPAE